MAAFFKLVRSVWAGGGGNQEAETPETLKIGLQELGATCTDAELARIVKACQQEARTAEDTTAHIFENAKQTTKPLETLLVCWKEAPADKKGLHVKLVDWIRHV